MDNENYSSEEKTNDVIENTVKKIIVPVALTVGLLGNSSAADAPMNLNNINSASSEVLSSEAFDPGMVQVTFDSDADEDDEDEEKRSCKGKNLAVSSAGASLLTSSAAAEMTLMESGSDIVFSVLAFSAKFAGIFAILSVIFMGMFKALYPARKLKEILTKKNAFRILIASVAVFAVIYVCDSLLSQRNIFMELMKNAFFLAVMLILWYRIFELKGKFGQVMKDLFWGNKGKWVFIGLLCFNILMSILHIIYNTFLTANSFTTLLVFYVICVISVFGIYELCKGRMVEDDELTKQTD